MKIAHSIFLSFAVILVLFAITTFNDYKLSQDVKENTEYYTKSTAIIKSCSRIQRNILSIHSGLQGYLLTGEKSFVETYNATSKDNDDLLHELFYLLSDSTQIRQLHEIKVLNDVWNVQYNKPLIHLKTSSLTNKENIDKFKKVYADKFLSGKEKNVQLLLQDEIREFTAFEYKIREERKEKLTASVAKIRNVSFILTIISVVIAFIVVGVLINKISKRINKMTTMANRIADGDYNYNISDMGNDELSSLAHSLNYMADKLSNNIALLRHKNQELDQFAHIVSHDMKSPLRGIGNVVAWIEEDHNDELSPKVREYINLIKGRITKAENLIEGLLEYARIGKEPAKIESVDVNEIIRDIAGNTDNNNVKIQYLQLPIFNTEKLLLFQVFSNLVNNAIKYNDKENILIQIQCIEHSDSYEFIVKDNGIGIAKQHYQRIFTIFQVLNDGNDNKGTGVGLAIVKKILDSKGQTIRVTSEIGKGTIFSFTWPKIFKHEAN